MWLSITIRPRELNREWNNLIIEYFKMKKLRYIIGLENDNHYQIAVETDTRSNNMRRTLNSLLKFTPEDDDEAKYWLKIKAHDNPTYLIGYCAKDDLFETNLDDIDYYKKSYEEQNKVINNYKQNWVCSGINRLFDTAYKWITDNGISTTCGIRQICIRMHSMGLLPLSLIRKLRKNDEFIWQDYTHIKASLKWCVEFSDECTIDVKDIKVEDEFSHSIM